MGRSGFPEIFFLQKLSMTGLGKTYPRRSGRLIGGFPPLHLSQRSKKHENHNHQVNCDHYFPGCLRHNPS
jgi:hypothetical protein